MREYGPKKIIQEEIGKDGIQLERRELNVMPLSESSLNQMMQHGKTGMIIISSQVSQIDRTDPELSLRNEFEAATEGIEYDSDGQFDAEQEWLRRRNAIADKELKRDIMKSGFSFTPVFGGYQGEEAGASYEPSYVVYCYDKEGQLRDFQELEALALKWCKKYKQESVYVQRPGQPPIYLDYNGNQVNSKSSQNFKFNRDKETYFTTNKRDKTNPQRFTADIVFENMYIQLRPGDYNENMRRRKSGEYIL